MAVLMAKSERVRLAYSDYKHLSTDNLTFVAGLRGRPVPAPASEPVRRKIRLPKGDALDGEELDDDYDDDDDVSFLPEAPVARKACVGRSCVPRAEVLEATLERRVVTQTARHKAQLRLASMRERVSEAETKLDEAKAEMIRMSESIAEGEERQELLHDALRNDGPISKACEEELALLNTEAMNLRRTFEADSLPPQPAAPALPCGSVDFNDGRNLQSPVPALGQTETRTLLDGRDWVHSGQLGHTRIFMRPPRPSRPDQPTKGKRETPAKKDAGSGTPAKEGGDSVRTPKRAGLGTGLGAALGAGAERWAGVAKRRLDNRLDGEDAWSCCGRTVAAAGRGCEPREPAATPKDLLLDTIDPRSRLGQPLDFREFLPRIAWFGSSLDPSEFMFAAAAASAFCSRRWSRFLSATSLMMHAAVERVSNSWGNLQGYLVRRWRAAVEGAHDEGNEESTIAAPHGAGEEEEPQATESSQETSEEALPSPPLQKMGGDADATKDRRAHLAGDGADGTFDCGGSGRGDCLSRTHILGMNGGRLPREVRQVPVDRPLTAPCGKGLPSKHLPSWSGGMVWAASKSLFFAKGGRSSLRRPQD
eukprot:jgi/Undpi1/5051/HiC_scaffold_19.g08403.m1